ncbi:MAG: Ig-like domain-containing protein, partial [Bacteroidales bacterium]|nr:Ig-like domain-containing protein [Bacteroidales bacterium]
VEDVHVAGISLNLDTLRIEDGKNKSLTVTFTPAAVSNKTVAWISTDESVATVSATYNGASVKPVGNGEALIIGQSEDGGFADTCVVLVSNLVVTPVTGVVISNKTLALTLGGSGRMLTAKVLPDTATRKDITWESTDEAVATVSAMGTVTAKAGGEAKIIVKTVDGGFADTCTVTVRVLATGVTLDKTAEELTVGDELALIATVLPENATNKACTWASSNAEVASVSETGVVKALAVGETTITVSTVDGGFTEVCKVTVKAASVPDDPTVAVTGVSLNKQADTLQIGDELALIATVLPENATNKACTWASSNAEVASVSETGVVKALAVGETTITVSTVDGNFTADCKIIVRTVVDTVIGGDTTAIQNLQPLALSVYPNPTVSEFHIEIAEPALLEVFTITGHLVFQKNATPGVHTFKPERSGLYLIRLSSGKRSTVLRAVKR